MTDTRPIVIDPTGSDLHGESARIAARGPASHPAGRAQAEGQPAAQHPMAGMTRLSTGGRRLVTQRIGIRLFCRVTVKRFEALSNPGGGPCSV
jgi:hypothetical protein